MFRPKRTLHAVNGVDLDIHRGEVVAVVGESGCGKSTLARMLLGLLPPSAGAITLEGRDLRSLRRRALARRMQPVFRTPILRSTRAAGSRLSWPCPSRCTPSALRPSAGGPRSRCWSGSVWRSASPALPNELSGGQRQRVAIARALVMRPEIVICDEPTSALDVSVQSQILNLLLELRRELGLTYVFISHNLAVIEHVATRVAVMYLGRMVEIASTAALFGRPVHPYTRALLQSVLTPEPGLGIPETGLGLGFPDPLNPPPGCPFHPRCPNAIRICPLSMPPLVPTAAGIAACHVHAPAERAKAA